MSRLLWCQSRRDQLFFNLIHHQTQKIDVDLRCDWVVPESSHAAPPASPSACSHQRGQPQGGLAARVPCPLPGWRLQGAGEQVGLDGLLGPGSTNDSRRGCSSSRATHGWCESESHLGKNSPERGALMVKLGLSTRAGSLVIWVVI